MLGSDFFAKLHSIVVELGSLLLTALVLCRLCVLEIRKMLRPSRRRDRQGEKTQ